MKLKKATIDDTWLIYDWMNEPTTRKNFFINSPIKRNSHASWYKGALKTSKMYTINNGNKLGFIRIEDGIVSIAIDKNHRRMGYAFEALKLLFKKHKKLEAYIDLTNKPSIKLFEKLGFKKFCVGFQKERIC